MRAPSVNQGAIEGGLQVNGASGSENQFTIDGVATNSLLNGQSRQDTVFEYLQGIQVKTVGIPAEFGGALGGVISAVTKSGGNTFRGEGHYYYLGACLAPRPVKRLVVSPVDERSVSYFQDPKRPITATRSAARSAVPSFAAVCSSSARSRRGSDADRRVQIQQRPGAGHAGEHADDR